MMQEKVFWRDSFPYQLLLYPIWALAVNTTALQPFQLLPTGRLPGKGTIPVMPTLTGEGQKRLSMQPQTFIQENIQMKISKHFLCITEKT